MVTYEIQAHYSETHHNREQEFLSTYNTSGSNITHITYVTSTVYNGKYK